MAVYLGKGNDPTVVVYESEVDNALVIHIDTDGIPDDGENGPKIRIYLNDNPVYEDPVFPGLAVSDHLDPEFLR